MKFNFFFVKGKDKFIPIFSGVVADELAIQVNRRSAAMLLT